MKIDGYDDIKEGDTRGKKGPRPTPRTDHSLDREMLARADTENAA